MIIRDARVDEHLYIKELRYRAYKEHSKKINEKHWNILKNQVLSDADLQEGVIRIVAEIEGNIVGTVALFPPKVDAYSGLVAELNHPEIRMLAVSPEARGKGVARALIYECIERMKKEGFDYIGLHTSDFMESAVKLYERLRFERMPKFDFQPLDDGIIVKAYQYKIK